MYILTAVIIVVSWMVFIGGCSTGRTPQAGFAPSPEAPQVVQSSATVVSQSEEPSPSDAADRHDDVEVIYVFLDRSRSGDDGDVNDRIRREQRALQRDIEKQRRAVRRYSTTDRTYRNRAD